MKLFCFFRHPNRAGITSFSICHAAVLLFVGVMATAIVGCGSSSRSSVSDVSESDATPEILLSDYEEFNPNQFPDELVDERIEIQHDVPESLMQNRADVGVAQVVSGYRIQIFSSVDRDAALEAEDRIKNWMETLSSEAKLEVGMPERLSVYNQFKQPLYRIRVGDFLRRADAENIMKLMARSFQTVFVVPDQVTVYR